MKADDSYLEVLSIFNPFKPQVESNSVAIFNIQSIISVYPQFTN